MEHSLKRPRLADNVNNNPDLPVVILAVVKSNLIKDKNSGEVSAPVNNDQTAKSITPLAEGILSRS